MGFAGGYIQNVDVVDNSSYFHCFYITLFYIMWCKEAAMITSCYGASFSTNVFIVA